MPRFKVPVVWTQMGHYYIQADTIDEAAESAADLELPINGDYLEDSFEIDWSGIEELSCCSYIERGESCHSPDCEIRIKEELENG